MTNDYSATPLIKKLGIKDGYILRLIGTPEHYVDLLGTLPPNIEVAEEDSNELVDFIHFFTKEAEEFTKAFPKLIHGMKRDGMLWISWPKKASKVPSDMSDQLIRSVSRKAGLIDVKVCSVDEVWSGLKLMYRVKDR